MLKLPVNAPNSPYTQDVLRPKYCRHRRRKCTLARDGSACAFCTSRNVHCTLAANQLTHSNLQRQLSNLRSYHESLASENSGGSSDLPDQALCDELVGLYFDMIHDKQHILFHRPTFIADQQRGQVPLVLVYAIIALAARLVDPPS